MSDFLKLTDFIGSSHKAAIVAHSRPDGDAVGACTAMWSYLVESKGLKASIFLDNPWPESLSFLMWKKAKQSCFIHDLCQNKAEEELETCDLIICLDCRSFDRTGAMESTFKSAKAPKILIDHHLNAAKDEFDLVFSETEISSTCELLYKLLLQMPEINGHTEKLPQHCLTALMTGLTTDTNNFANSVFPGTLTMCSELLACGVDRELILDNILFSYPERRLRLIGHLLSDRMVITPEGAAYTVLDEEDIQRYRIREGEMEGFVNMPLSIDKVRMSIYLKDDGDRFRVSVRSKRGTSANSFAMRYCNGGGHERAAGGKLFVGIDIKDKKAIAPFIEDKVKEFFGQ